MSYGYEPVPDEIEPSQASRVLGLEGAMWGEKTPADEDVDGLTWPRLCALAEVGWSDPARDFNDFSIGMDAHFPRVQAMGVTVTSH